MSAIPWWRSKIVVGAGIAAISAVVKTLGISKDLPVDAVTQAVTDVALNGATIGGALIAAGARITQAEAPKIVLGKKKAEELSQPAEPPSHPYPMDINVRDVLDNTSNLEVPSWMQR